MGRHQRAETLGLISFLFCSVIAFAAMSLYIQFAPAIWQVTQRRLSVCAGVICACGVVSFCIGYASNSRSLTLKHGWWMPIRRIFEIVALSVVYAATIFLSSFAMLNAVNSLMGMHLFGGYLPAVCAGFAGVVGYITFVQAELMNAKTIASLLPLFVISGVGTAGLTTDDPNWYHNNFSQLGDRTTFAANMFNATLMLAGTCIIIVSYFAVSELITTERLQRLCRRQMQAGGAEISSAARQGAAGGRGGAVAEVKHDVGRETRHDEIPHFRVRIVILSTLLTVSGLAFIGIGVFRYTPHYIMHNVCAKGLPIVMGVLLLALPWLAPRLSKAMYVVSDLAILVCAAFGINMLMGYNTLTNVEALAGMFFLGWFIVFSRQIAAIEADRVQQQLVILQAGASLGIGDAQVIAAARSGSGVDAGAMAEEDRSAAALESRLASDR